MVPSKRSEHDVKNTLSGFLVCWRWGLFAVTDKQGDTLHSYANFVNTKNEENVKISAKFCYQLVNVDASNTAGKSHGQNLARSAFKQRTVYCAFNMLAGYFFKAFLVDF